MKRRAFSSVLFTCWLSAFSNSAAELPVRTFFRSLQYRQVELSPDGNYLAVLAQVTNAVGLYTVNLKNNEATWVRVDSVAEPVWFDWASTNRLIISLKFAFFPHPALMAVNRDGTGTLELFGPSLYAPTRFLGLLPDSPDEILVTSFTHSKKVSDSLLLFPSVERMNVFTGKRVLEAKNPGHVIHWVMDHHGVLRIGMERNSTKIRMLHRPNANASWEPILSYDFDLTKDPIWPVGFGADNRTLLVEARHDRNTLALFRYDLESRSLGSVLFGRAEADFDGAVISRSDRSVVGASYCTQRPKRFWSDADYQALQETADSVLTDTINTLVSGGPHDRRAVFLSTSDRTPGVYYMMDTATMAIHKLFERADWIKPEEMSEVRTIEFPARDGLTISGLLTIPRGRSAKSLPLVVKVRKTAFSRDVWGFDREAQFLANRGYAVLQVNFRGSYGFGSRFLAAGFHQCGLKQQDDIADGVKWVVSQGIADPSRVAICGAGYGGFAALTGIEQTPELYRCAISYAGWIDILRALKPSEPGPDLPQAIVAQAIGDRKKDKERLKQVSPAEHLDRTQVPVLLASREHDHMAPHETAQKVAAELKKRGKLYDFFVESNPPRQSNLFEFWTKVDEFLKANLQ